MCLVNRLCSTTWLRLQDYRDTLATCLRFRVAQSSLRLHIKIRWSSCSKLNYILLRLLRVTSSHRVLYFIVNTRDPNRGNKSLVFTRVWFLFLSEAFFLHLTHPFSSFRHSSNCTIVSLEYVPKGLYQV